MGTTQKFIGLLALGVGVVAVACSGGDDERTPALTPTPFPTVASSPGEASPRPPIIGTPAFSEGARIPTRHTCEGEDVSPALTWSAGTTAILSIALLVDDPDAPGGTFSHWLVFDMPPDSTGLAENAAQDSAGVTGRNDFGTRAYRGPCPPPGSPHTYRFTVYYLDSVLGDSVSGLDDDSERDQFLKAAEGHVLQQATLTGLFSR